MLRALIAIGVVAGCGFQVASQPAGTEAGVADAALVDAARDAPADAPADAPPDAPPACGVGACSQIGGICQGNECVVNVVVGGALTCPAGLRCRFNCNSGIACKMGIDCSAALGCRIDCAVMNSCQGSTVNCTGPGCTLFCRQMNTCTNMSFRCGLASSSCRLECCPGTSCGTVQTLAGELDQQSPGTCP